jgi:Arc/MetJ-type ribon-helix-helix transcriptional regulator
MSNPNDRVDTERLDTQNDQASVPSTPACSPANTAAVPATEITVQLTDANFRLIRRLSNKKLGAFDSASDLLNQALTLIGWAVAEVKTGGLIASIQEMKQTYREIRMPFIDRLQGVAKETSAPASVVTATVRLETTDAYLQLIGILTSKESGFFDSESDLLNQAVVLIGWAVTRIRKGSTIAGVHEHDDRYREVTMPFIERLQFKKVNRQADKVGSN